MERHNPEKYNPKEVPSLNDFDYFFGHSQNDTDTIKVYQKPNPSDLANRTSSKLSSSRTQSRPKRPLHQSSSSSSSSNNSSTLPVKRQRANPVDERPALLEIGNSNNNGNTSSTAPQKKEKAQHNGRRRRRQSSKEKKASNSSPSLSFDIQKQQPSVPPHIGHEDDGKSVVEAPFAAAASSAHSTTISSQSQAQL